MRSEEPKLGEGQKENRIAPVILALDPGTFSTAWVVYDTDTGKLLAQGHEPNKAVLGMLRGAWPCVEPKALVIEMLKSYGNALGDTVLETCVWIGRFIEAWNAPGVAFEAPVVRLPRKTIVTHLCNNPRAGDTNVRAELLNRFGRTREAAVGTKQKPGPLYGVTGDMWSALAVAVVYADLLVLESKRIPTYLSTAHEVWHDEA